MRTAPTLDPWGKFINIMMSVKWMFHTFIAMYLSSYESLLKLSGFYRFLLECLVELQS